LERGAVSKVEVARAAWFWETVRVAAEPLP
jgi:hypothetical protein